MKSAQSKQSESLVYKDNDAGAWDSPDSRRKTRVDGSSSSRKTQSRSRMRSKGSDQGEPVITIMPRKLEKQFKRVAEIEKLAKQLEKDLEEKANQHDINQYFDELPTYFSEKPLIKDNASGSR